MTAPYYPGITTTPNLGLSLVGMDEVVAEDFVLIDAFAGGVSGSIEVNGSVVNNPNFVDSATVTFGVVGSDISLTAVGGGGSSSGLNVFTAGTASPTTVFSNPEAPSTLNPSVYVQDKNGSWHQMAGMDTSTAMSSNQGADSNPTNPQGILLWDRMMYFRDSNSSVQSGKNAFLSVNHAACVGTSYNNQDRAVWIGMGNLVASVFQFSIDSSNNVTFLVDNLTTGYATQNSVGFRVNQRVQASGLSVGTYLNGVPLSVQSVTAISGGQQTIVCSDSGFTHSSVGLTSDSGSLNQVMYSMANLQMEQDIVGTPSMVAAVDTEFSTLSLQMSDQHVGTVSAPNYGANSLRIQYYREAGAGIWGSVHPSNIKAIVTNNNDGTHGQDTLTNIVVQATSQPGNNDIYFGVHVGIPSPRFGSNNYGLYIDSFGSNTSDYALYIAGGQINLGGTITNVGAWPLATANTFLSGPTSGAAAAAVFRAVVAADLPVFVGDSGTGGVQGAVPAPSAGQGATGYFLSAAGNWQIPSVPASSVAWNNITSATGNMSVNLGAFTTEFDQSSNAAWLWKNTTTATVSTTNASPLLEIAANYWTGAASAQDTWTIGSSLVAGSNAISTLTIAHSGSTGAAQIALPTPLSFGVSSPQVIGPAGASAGISIGAIAGAPLIVAAATGSLDVMRGYQGGTLQGSVSSQSASGSFGAYAQVNTGTAELGLGIAPANTATRPLASIGHSGAAWTSTTNTPCIGLNLGSTIALGGSNSLHLNWAPQYGSGSFIGELNAPTINQVLITNTVVGSALVTNVGALVFSTANAYAASALIQVSLGTNTALNGTQTLVSQAQRAGSTYTITNSSETAGSVVTLTVGTHNVVGNDWVFLTGLTTATWLNGQTVKVSSVVANVSITFTDLSGHGTSASHADTGTVTDNFATFSLTHANITGSADTGTVNQQSTGSYTALKIAVTETLLQPTSSNRLIDCYGGASGTASLFAVDNKGKITEYNSGVTVSQGVASEIYQTLNSSLNANFNAGSAVTMFTPTVAKAYRITACMGSNVAATGGTLPSLTVGWTDAGGVARTYTLLASTSTSATTDYVQGTLVIYTNNSTAVTITSAAYAAGSGTALTYSLSVTAEAL